MEPAFALPQLAVRRGREAVDFYIAAFEARQIYRVAGTDDAPEVVAELAIGDTPVLGLWTKRPLMATSAPRRSAAAR